MTNSIQRSDSLALRQIRCALQAGSRRQRITENKTQVFSGVTPANFARLVEKVNAAGIEISGNSGQASKMGVEVAWNYSEETQQLELTCLHAPFFVSADDVNTKLRTLVGEALAS